MSKSSRKRGQSVAPQAQVLEGVRTPGGSPSPEPVVSPPSSDSSSSDPEEQKDPSQDPDQTDDQKETPKSSRYVVAQGRGITTRARGIVSSGSEVFSSDFSGGESRIADLISAGYLDRK